MSILPPQSGLLAGTEYDDAFWRAASTSVVAQVKAEPVSRPDDASSTWAAFGDYLWLVAGTPGKPEQK